MLGPKKDETSEQIRYYTMRIFVIYTGDLILLK